MPAREEIAIDKTFKLTLWEFSGLALIGCLLPALAAIDICLMLRHTYAEMPLTELTQQVLLGLTMVLFWRQAVRDPRSRRFYVLVAGFFTCAFIRELDNWLELWLPDGSWAVPAVLLAAAAILYALSGRQQIAGPMRAMANSRAWVFMMIGLVILLAYSRILGSGALIWGKTLQDGSANLVKTVIQESLELLGYVLISYGSLLYTLAPRNLAGQVEPGGPLTGG